MVGYLVGKIAQQPFERFLRERLFDPLDMHDTDFSLPASEADRLAACYAATPDRKFRLLSISMFSEAAYSGVGFGLGFAVTVDSARTLVPGNAGDFAWGGMASTYFWIDPREEPIVIFLTQFMPSSTYPVRRELRTLVYSAFE